MLNKTQNKVGGSTVRINKSNAKPEFFQVENFGGAEHPRELLALLKVSVEVQKHPTRPLETARQPSCFGQSPKLFQ